MTLQLSPSENRLRIQFVKNVFQGEDGYPPSGWYDLNGEIGKSAIMWSLCSWRADISRRATVYIPLSAPYDYWHTCVEWAHMDPNLIIFTRQRNNLLRYAYNWAKTGLVGQICFEDLGFLMGSGRLTEDVRWCLGDIRWFYELRNLAEVNDIAIFATSYNVGVSKNQIEQFSLGGPHLLDLCYKQRILLSHEGFTLKAARRSGELIKISNTLDLQNRVAHVEIRYREGPIRVRRTLMYR